jgi:hypothetical protein
MQVGHQSQFAIEWEIDEVNPPWIIGHIRFWAHDQPIGNWDDFTSLNGCANWLCVFASEPENRFEPDLLSRSKEEIFHLLYASFMYDLAMGSRGGEEPFEGTYRRFNISHLGMSSFDRYVVLLVEEPQRQRLVWQSSEDYLVKEAMLPSGEMQRVAQEFCTAMQSGNGVAPTGQPHRRD